MTELHTSDTGFAEQENVGKIKITVSGLKFATPTGDMNFPEKTRNLDNYTYNGSALKLNSVFWDNKYGWINFEN